MDERRGAGRGFADHLVGTRLQEGRLLVVRKVGEGAMGAVFEILDTKRDRTYGLKVVASSDFEFLRRFRREGGALEKVVHPNVMRVYGFVEVGSWLGLVCELAPGRDLAHLLAERGRFAVEDALWIVEESALGMAAVHEKNLLHRDLKPGNIVVDEEKRSVKIVDFGMAKDLDATSQMTMPGTFLGTPHYAAPERLTGDDVDGRADIYSLGVILYELLTGDVPIDDPRTSVIFERQVLESFEDPRARNEEVTAPVAKLLERMTAKRASRRLRDCGEVARQIAALRSGAVVEGGLGATLKKMFRFRTVGET